MLKSHENPMCDAQNPMENPIRLQDPKTKFEMAGPSTRPWPPWIAQMVRKPWRRKTVRAPFCGAPWTWGIYGEDPFFRDFFGDTPEFGWVNMMWNTSFQSFLDTAFSSVFVFFNAPVLEDCVSCSSWNGFLPVSMKVTGDLPHYGAIRSRFHLLSVWFFSDVSIFALRLWNIQHHPTIFFQKMFWPLVICYSAIEHGPVEIVDLPSQKMVDLSHQWTFTRPGRWSSVTMAFPHPRF